MGAGGGRDHAADRGNRGSRADDTDKRYGASCMRPDDDEDEGMGTSNEIRRDGADELARQQREEVERVVEAERRREEEDKRRRRERGD